MKYTLASLIIFMPAIANAHVKWFTDVGAENIPPYSLFDWRVWVGIIIALITIAFGIYFEKRFSVPYRLEHYIKRWQPVLLSLAGMGIGASLLIFTYFGFIFAPNLPVSGTIGAFLLGLQALIGLGFFLGAYVRVSGLFLIILYVLTIMHFGFFEMMDALEILGFGLYGFIVERSRLNIVGKEIFQGITKNIGAYGVPFLRIFTGINLLVLGFSEKILHPDLGIKFLATYDWNFMQHIGITWFSDYWFVFSAGLTEALFGIFFIFGLITRITIVFLAIFLIITLILLGPMELIGHLPHFSIALILFLLGSGTRLKIQK